MPEGQRASASIATSPSHQLFTPRYWACVDSEDCPRRAEAEQARYQGDGSGDIGHHSCRSSDHVKKGQNQQHDTEQNSYNPIDTANIKRHSVLPLVSFKICDTVPYHEPTRNCFPPASASVSPMTPSDDDDHLQVDPKEPHELPGQERPEEDRGAGWPRSVERIPHLGFLLRCIFSL